MSPRILIVDDEPLIRMMLVEAFRDLGAEVVAADSGDAAWAVLQSGQTFDLVFTDHVMPGSRTGTQLIADIENQFPRVRTALATGYMRGDQSANVSVFHKPYDVSEVAQTLLKMVAGSPFETQTDRALRQPTATEGLMAWTRGDAMPTDLPPDYKPQPPGTDVPPAPPGTPAPPSGPDAPPPPGEAPPPEPDVVDPLPAPVPSPATMR